MKLLTAGTFICIFAVAVAEDIANSFKSSEIVPDVLTTAPNELLIVNFKDNAVQFSQELTPTQVKDVPNLAWNAEPSAFYTICMTDPDAPSRAEPKSREFLHWLVANVPASDLSQGETLAAYVGSGPPKGTGLHRYVLLVYKQPGKLDVSNLARVGNDSRDGRPNFSIQKFAELHKLGNPIAGNMYQAQYDDYVPILHKQLSG